MMLLWFMSAFALHAAETYTETFSSAGEYERNVTGVSSASAGLYGNCLFTISVPSGKSAMVKVEYNRDIVPIAIGTQYLKVTANGSTSTLAKGGSVNYSFSTSKTIQVSYAKANSSVYTSGSMVCKITISYATIASYTVTYNPGSYGSGSQQTATKTQDVSLTLKGAIFTRSGYTQTGWATSDGGAKVYELNGTYTTNAALQLYPYWTADAASYVEVMFRRQGPMPSTDTYTFKVGSAYGESFPSTQSATGYTFNGWNTKSDGSGTWIYSTTIASVTITTLYGIWTKDATATYTVTYSPGSYGSGSQQTVSKTQDVALTLAGALFTRTGYTQTGWATSDGGSFAYALGGSYTANASVTLYPYWIPVVPSNDGFSGAATVYGSSGSTTGSNVGATSQSGEPLVSYVSSATTTVWWKWTATSSGTVQFDTIGTSFDTVMGVYTGSSVTALTMVTQDDDSGGIRTSKCTFDCSSGTTYYICVGGYGAATGTITLNWSLTTAVSTLSSISISGVASVVGGQTACYTCTANYSDGSTITVTPVWSIASGASYASINSFGVLSANTVTESQIVTVRASYTDGVQKTKTLSVTITPPVSQTYIVTIPPEGGSASTTFTTAGTSGSYLFAGSSHPSWITAISTKINNSITIGSGDNTISLTGLFSVTPTFTAIANTSGAVRSWDYVISGPETYTVTVQQESNATYPDLTVKALDSTWPAAIFISEGKTLTPCYSFEEGNTNIYFSACFWNDGSVDATDSFSTRLSIEDLSGTCVKSFEWTCTNSPSARAGHIPFYWGWGGWSFHTLSAGQYNLKVTVDSGSDIEESNESNNTASFSFTVTEPTAYTVTYAPGSYGTGSRQTETKTYGASLTLKGAIFTRSGYTQTGWATSDGGTQAYALCASYTANAAITLYPVWTAVISAQTALDNSSLTFTTGGDSNWYGQTSITHDGVDAMRSGPITHSQSTWMQTMVTGSGTISFWWYASSESTSWDYLCFSVDGVSTNIIGGTSCDWSQCSYYLPEGNHTLKWTYRKDGSFDSGEGAGFVDQVVWTPDSTKLPDGGPYTNVVNGVSWKYTISGGKAMIGTGETYSLGCAIDRGITGALMIPSILGGCPVTSVGQYAFYFCTKITGVTIPPSVTNIGKNAFTWCSGLLNVSIPSSVLNIDAWAFSECTSLVSVMMSEGVTNIGNYAFYDCSGLKSVTIPSSVISIDNSAFSGCKEMASVMLLDGLTSIGNCAFMNCSSMTSVTIPSSVTNIGYCAFDDCTNLTCVTVPGWKCEIDFSSVTNLIISDGTKSIGDGAFYGCRGLMNVMIPSSVTSIGGEAFGGCTNMTSISVSPDNYYYTSMDGLLYDRGLGTLIACPGSRTTVTIPSSVTDIGKGAFEGCYSLMSVAIPLNVTNICDWAFSYCIGLTNIEMSSSVASIGNGAFEGCSRLTNVTMPYSLINIGNRAFSHCVGLTNVTISSSVTSIGSSAFIGCNGLTSILIPSDVTNIGECAFMGCDELSFIGVSCDNAHYISKDGVLFNKSMTQLMVFPSGITGAYAVPNGVTDITGYAFGYCRGLNSVTIPSSVMNIGKYAFWNCDALTTVYVDAGDATRVQTLLSNSGFTTSGLTFVETYPVTYDPGSDGTGTLQTVVKTNGVDLVLAGAIFTRAGYTQTGWATSDGGEQAYALGATYTEDAAITLYPVWMAIETKIATPVISPTDGSAFADSCTITITCATEGASIYYTTNGNTPKLTAKYLYSAPFTVYDSVKVKAVATKTGLDNSDTIVAEISKLPMTLGNAIGAKDGMTVTTGGDKNWEPVKDATAKSGVLSAKSGLQGDDDDEGESWLQVAVDGQGSLTFWAKTSCEHDYDGTCTWDHLEVYADGVEQDEMRMDDETDWTQKTIEFTKAGAHTVKWRYTKDESDYEGEDCAWINGVVWTPSAAPVDPIPDIGDTPTAEEVKTALDGSADAKLVTHITGADDYNAYRAWSQTVKKPDGSAAAGQQAVKDSENAWLSFALHTDKLIETAPTNGQMKIDTFAPATVSGNFDMTISLDGIEIGSAATEDNLKQVFGIEGSSTLEPNSFSSANVSLEFGTPAGGKVKCTAVPADKNSGSFFMKMKMK